jgi:hypothetical protein
MDEQNLNYLKEQLQALDFPQSLFKLTVLSRNNTSKLILNSKQSTFMIAAKGG